MRNEDRRRLDYNRGQAARFFCENYSREKRYLIILARDLQKNYNAISELGIEKAKSFQLFYDFILDFENLKEKMSEFRWTGDFLRENGIDFKSLRKLYFAVC